MPAKRRKAKKRSRDWFSLQEQLVRRWSTYMQEVGELFASGSLEPREWAWDYARMLNTMASDTGDWLTVEEKQPLRPTANWAYRARTTISRRARKASIPIKVPLDAFMKRKTITLATDGLSRGDRAPDVLRPKDGNVTFKRRTLARTGRRATTLEIAKLPGGGLPRGTYTGMVCAQETDYVVAVVELVVK